LSGAPWATLKDDVSSKGSAAIDTDKPDEDLEDIEKLESSKKENNDDLTTRYIPVKISVHRKSWQRK
jgi:hypothetical protein